MSEEKLLTKINRYYKTVSKYWGIYSNTLNSLNGFRFNNEFNLHILKIAELAKLDNNQKILECGCGFGKNLSELQKIFNKSNFTGISISPNHIENKVFDNVSLQNYNYTSFENSGFDRVLFIESFSHSFNKQKTFNEIYRVLKPGGILFILDLSVPNEYFEKLVYNKKERENYLKHINFYGDKPISYNALIKKAEKTKFTLLDYKENLPNYIINNSIIEKLIIIKTIPTHYNYYVFKK
jgi:ubiquinone/menaquinone biosynthesis C-methylase UbiE